MAAKDRQVGGDHYQRRIQPWDIVDEYGLDYYEGNAIKYILRWKGDRAEDLKKAIHYLEKEIEMYEESEKEAPWGLFMTDEEHDEAIWDANGFTDDLFMDEEEREEAVNTASREPQEVYDEAKRLFTTKPTDTIRSSSEKISNAYGAWPAHKCANCGETYVVTPNVQSCRACGAHVTYSPL